MWNMSFTVSECVTLGVWAYSECIGVNSDTRRCVLVNLVVLDCSRSWRMFKPID